MLELSCTECADLCPDVALGVAEAETRASVLAHVEGCRSCRDELGSMSAVADLLCQLAPSIHPPRGFATRVVRAISTPASPDARPTSSRRSYVRPLSVAAAVVVAAAAAGGGWLAAQGGSAPPATTETASLVTGHRSIGHVVVTPGERPWISVAVHLGTGVPEVRCEVESASGAWRTVGTFDVYSGWGYWAAPLPKGVVVRGAELLTPGGSVLARATFTT